MTVEFWLLLMLSVIVIAGLVGLIYYIHGELKDTREFVNFCLTHTEEFMINELRDVHKVINKRHVSLMDEVDSLKIILDGVEQNVLELVDKKDAEEYEKITLNNESDNKEDLNEEIN